MTQATDSLKYTSDDWITDDPEAMRVMVSEKLNELYEDKAKETTARRQAITDTLTAGSGDWAHHLIAEYADENITAIDRQIRKFQRIANRLNPDNDRITDDDIDLARQTPMDSLIPDLKPYGSGKKCARCPFHTEKTASFVVFDNNRFTCFGCNESGSPIDYVMKKDGLTFIEAVKSLINK